MSRRSESLPAMHDHRHTLCSSRQCSVAAHRPGRISRALRPWRGGRGVHPRHGTPGRWTFALVGGVAHEARRAGVGAERPTEMEASEALLTPSRRSLLLAGEPRPQRGYSTDLAALGKPRGQVAAELQDGSGMDFGHRELHGMQGNGNWGVLRCYGRPDATRSSPARARQTEVRARDVAR